MELNGNVRYGTNTKPVTNDAIPSSQALFSLLSTDLTHALVKIDCLDPDGCTTNDFDKTAADDGQILTIVNISANSSVVRIALNAGTIETGGIALLVLAQWESAQFMYVDDRWVLISTTGSEEPV